MVYIAVTIAYQGSSTLDQFLDDTKNLLTCIILFHIIILLCRPHYFSLFPVF